MSSRSFRYIRHHFHVTSLTSHMRNLTKRVRVHAWSIVRAIHDQALQCVSLPMPKAMKNEFKNVGMTPCQKL